MDFLKDDEKRRVSMVSNATISRSLQNWRTDPEQGLVKERLERFLRSSGHGLRNPETNELLGFVTSKPKTCVNDSQKILGVAYYDKKEGKDNEDLFEINKFKVTSLKPKEASQIYPEYDGYHKEEKSFLREG